MATLVITIGNDDCVNEGINIICNQCRPIYMNEDNKIIVNVVGEEKFDGKDDNVCSCGCFQIIVGGGDTRKFFFQFL